MNSATDRTDILSDGDAVYAVGFNFLPGSHQLAVYVGGILQQQGLHYIEIGSNQVGFDDPYIPSVGELLSFVNIVGGEGPPGAGNLQQAYSNGAQVLVNAGSPMALSNTDGTDTTSMFEIGHPSSPGGFGALKVSRDGQLIVNRLIIRDLATGTKSFFLEVDLQGNLRLRSATLNNEFGIKVNSDNSGVEFGRFPDLNAPGTTGGSVRTGRALFRLRCRASLARCWSSTRSFKCSLV